MVSAGKLALKRKEICKEQRRNPLRFPPPVITNKWAWMEPGMLPHAKRKSALSKKWKHHGFNIRCYLAPFHASWEDIFSWQPVHPVKDVTCRAEPSRVSISPWQPICPALETAHRLEASRYATSLNGHAPSKLSLWWSEKLSQKDTVTHTSECIKANTTICTGNTSISEKTQTHSK